MDFFRSQKRKKIHFYEKDVFLEVAYYQKYIVENATGTAQMGFYLEQMRKSFIAIPPLAEQSRIVAKVEELFSALDQMERNLV